MKNRKTPQVRFAGFTGDWEERKLGNVYTERKERGNDSLPILSVSIHHGVSNGELDSDTLGKNVRRSEDKSLYKHVYFGDLVFNMMRAWQGAIGVVKSEGMVSPAYITAIPSAEIYPLFMDYCLRRDETIIQIDNLSYGVTDFRKRLYWDSFINVLCRIPSVSEQERITAFFNQLDNLIDIHQQELTTLKQTKQGFLQKMFPREGETVPEVRFPGFSGAWEQRTVSELADRYDNLRVPITASDRVAGNTPYYGANGIQDYVEGFTHDGEFILVAEDGANDLQNYPVQYVNGKVWVNNHAHVLQAKSEVADNKFLMSALKQTNIEPYLVGGGRAKLNADVMMKISFRVPELAEQKQIGSFFANLNHLITLHQRELDALKETKKAFLQKMFV